MIKKSVCFFIPLLFFTINCTSCAKGTQSPNSNSVSLNQNNQNSNSGLESTKESTKTSQNTQNSNVKKISVTEIVPKEVSSKRIEFYDGMGMFYNEGNDRYGYLDSKGNVIIEPKYNSSSGMGYFYDGYTILTKGDYSGLVIIDKKGNETSLNDKFFATVDCTYFTKGVAFVRVEGESGTSAIDTSGNILYTHAGFPEKVCANGRVIWNLGESIKTKVIDNNHDFSVTDIMGNTIIEGLKKNDDSINISYSDNLLTLQKNLVPSMGTENSQNYGCLDQDGNITINFNYEKLGRARDGLIWFLKYGKYGYMDYKENIIIKPQFENVTGFSDGIALVKMEDKWKFINKKAEIVGEIDLPVDKVEYYKSLVIINKSTFVNTKGEVIFEAPPNQEIIYHGGDIFTVGYPENSETESPCKIYKINGL